MAFAQRNSTSSFVNGSLPLCLKSNSGAKAEPDLTFRRFAPSIAAAIVWNQERQSGPVFAQRNSTSSFVNGSLPLCLKSNSGAKAEPVLTFRRFAPSIAAAIEWNQERQNGPAFAQR
ncbi:hypothetical protein [Paenibacillus gorillae]|uniref:hypothetical protein n=1 Tax=Paenibacillus gorillae TaxID=1243662 RepID=UPI0005A9B854|nr:hypothetical protein [Paenibacillus gorillae]